MPQVTYPQVNGIITRSGELFIPDVIEDAILDSIVNDLTAVKQTGDTLKGIYSPTNHAVTLNYDAPGVADAYSLYYMRRSDLLPLNNASTS